MNIVEAVRKMKPNQKVYSECVQLRLVLQEDGSYLRYLYDDGTQGARIDFDFGEWTADDWKIEEEYVDFWTAWNAHKNEKKKIRSEYWHETVYYGLTEQYGVGDGRLTHEQIDGRWIIND